MTHKTRNILAWLAITVCTATTIGTIATSGSSKSTYFAIATWVSVFVVAVVSRPGHVSGDAGDAPPSRD